MFHAVKLRPRDHRKRSLLAGGAAATVAGFYWGTCFSGEYCIHD
jgi:hypothetical protein